MPAFVAIPWALCTIGSSGSIAASVGDTYQIAGGFLSHSTVPAGWSVGGATLKFLSGNDQYLPGNNKNFAWGTLKIDADAKVTLEESGYVLSVLSGAGEGVGDILSAGKYTLYYDPSLNPGLGDKTWSLAGGGFLSPLPIPGALSPLSGGSPAAAPIPGAVWLLASGLAGLISIRRRTGRR